MSIRIASCLLAAAFACGGVLGQPIPLEPFVINHHNRVASAADVSFLLDAPAGRDGFVRVEGGHLVKPSGERLRIWGVNLTGWTKGSTLLPPKDEAPLWAATLARFGINCVRFHFLDLTTRDPADQAPRRRPSGLIDRQQNHTQSFDPEQLDRLDFFVAELKKRGIYTNLNLNVGRTYKEGDGVPDHDVIQHAKGMTFIGERLLELQRDYARQLLTHYNPYTKSEYRHEPAVAISNSAPKRNGADRSIVSAMVPITRGPRICPPSVIVRSQPIATPRHSAGTWSPMIAVGSAATNPAAAPIPTLKTPSPIGCVTNATVASRTA